MGARPKTSLNAAGLLTVDQVAEGLACGRSKVYRLAKQGALEIVKLGGQSLVTAKSVDRLLNLTKRGEAGARARRQRGLADGAT